MATVVYVPKDERYSDIGKGLSAGLSGYFNARMQQRAAEQEMAAMQEIMNSPDRTTAMEKAMQATADPQKLKSRFDIINERFPVKDTTPVEVKGYNPETGTFESKFIPRGNLEDLGSPEGRQKYFGSGETVISPTGVEEFFRSTPEGSYESLGKAPLQARPEQAVSASELERLSKQRSEELAQKRYELSEQRFNRLLEKGDTTTLSQELAKTRTYNSVVANLLNVKKSIGDQGQIILDFEGDSKKAEAYRNALEGASTYLGKFQGDVNKAAVNALKDTGYYTKAEEQPAPAATPDQQPQGFFTRLFSPGKQPGSATPTTPAKAATPAPQAGAIAKPKTKADFAKIPKGTRFINPADGKEYIKE